MTETTSNTKEFNLPVDEIITLAMEPIGGDHITSNETKKARNYLNLLLIDIQNRGVAPIHALTEVTLDLVSGSSENYLLSSQYFNVFDLAIRTSTSSGDVKDTYMERLSFDEWLQISNKKGVNGRPTQYLVDKQRSNIAINVWPVPENNSYSLYGWATQKVDDVNAMYQLIDMPTRYLDAIVKGLTYYLAGMRRLPIQERMYYKGEYEQALDLALQEDRERVDVNYYPYIKGC